MIENFSCMCEALSLDPSIEEERKETTKWYVDRCICTYILYLIKVFTNIIIQIFKLNLECTKFVSYAVTLKINIFICSENYFKFKLFKGRSNSTVGRMFVLQAANLGSIFSIY